MNYSGNIITGEIPDNEVIERVIRGEKNLYTVIVRRYNERLYRIAMSIVDDDADAEDIMQVTYIKAYENLGKFEFKANFSTWITRILINESLLKLKKKKSLTDLDDYTMNNEIQNRQITNGLNPEVSLLNTELKEILEMAIRRLPEKYRTVFIMREVENMNIAETRDCLNISEVNVKVRLNRAKTILKNSLSAFYKKEDILHFHCSRCDKMVERVLTGIEGI